MKILKIIKGIFFIFFTISTVNAQSAMAVLERFESSINLVIDPNSSEREKESGVEDLIALFSYPESVPIFDFLEFQRNNLGDYRNFPKEIFSQLILFEGTKIDFDILSAFYRTNTASSTLSNYSVNIILSTTYLKFDSEPIFIPPLRRNLSLKFFLSCIPDATGEYSNCKIDNLIFFPVSEDQDLDGFVNNDGTTTDKCPNIYGLIEGCPDKDRDGIADQNDDCPNIPGVYPRMVSGCPDSDGDGIVDIKDNCPNRAGVYECDGCPDSDSDGICDSEDSCPNDAGNIECQGCSDNDNDGECDYFLEQEWVLIKEYQSKALFQEFKSKYPFSVYFWEVDSILRNIENLPVREENNLMAFVEEGQFTMGCPSYITEHICDGDDSPHIVSVSSFYIDPFEVTNQQFANFLNEYQSLHVKFGDHENELMININDSPIRKINNEYIVDEQHKDLPTVHISWYGANEFSKFYGLSLPTEAEWEYAAKGGLAETNIFFSGGNLIFDVAWFQDNSTGTAQKVGQKKAKPIRPI